MQRVTIRLVRDSSNEREDDTIRVYDTDCSDFFRVDFRALDMKRTSSFFSNRHGILEYISDILLALTHDSDPFDTLQVETAIHPSILYHVIDMDQYEIRRLIEDTVDFALRRSIVKTDRE